MATTLVKTTQDGRKLEVVGQAITLGGCVVVRLSVVLELVESLLIDSRLVVLVSVVTLLAAKDHVMSPFRNRFKTNRLRAPNLNRPARP